jgi:glycosyltransferase involved in cell wall biosynthesis
MNIGVIADNLGGGSARVGETLINGLVSDQRVNSVFVFSNSRVNLLPNSKLLVVDSDQLPGFSKFTKRIHFLTKLPYDAIVFNLSNFPIGFHGLCGRREFVLLHNAYFFKLAPEVNFLRNPIFILRNSIARSLILIWRTFLSSPKLTSFLVQSDYMYQISRNSISKSFTINIICPHKWLDIVSLIVDKKHDIPVKLNNALESDICWFYPATGENHKNHILLLELLRESVKLNPNVKVILTLPENRVDSKKIIELAFQLGIHNNIINLGWISDSTKNYLMLYSTGVIFLSRFESLGLPLLEIRDLARPALVIKSTISEYILGKDCKLYDLYAFDMDERIKERATFSSALARGDADSNLYLKSPIRTAHQAYLIDFLGTQND